MDRLLEATWRAEQRHFWFRGFRQFTSLLLDRAAGGRTDLRVLDCGCGTGNNLVLLERYGRAWGFDLTWRGLEFARGLGRTRIAQASIADIPYASSAFDLVTSFDVLQSVTREQELSALQEMWRVLRPGGWLLLNVAAFEILRGNHSVLAEELHRFTKAELRDAVEGAGFRIERLTYSNASLFPLVLSTRMLQRLVGLATPEEAGREIAVPAAPVNATLTALLSIEARLLARFDMPLGSSLLCLARKNA